MSCGSGSKSTDEIVLSGKWVECFTFTYSETALLTEAIYSEGNTKLEVTAFESMDNQCINIETDPLFKFYATLVIDNPHLTTMGLPVYDYTWTDVTMWHSFSNDTGPLPDYYSILYLNDDKLYRGKSTIELSGSSEEKRHEEIDFLNFATRQ